ncbi:MAG: amidohydrolase family protein, partial [Planctomycetota bacterium]|jgi:imidazolonepropionase-like amidohydrolase
MKKEFGFEMVLLGGYDADRLAEELAAAEVAVVLPVMPDHHGPEHQRRHLSDRFSRLHEAGVEVALASGGVEGAELLLLARAGELVAAGVDQDAVWASLTTVPARILGLDAYGALGTGRSATMILFGGSSPFDASAPFKAHKPR